MTNINYGLPDLHYKVNLYRFKNILLSLPCPSPHPNPISFHSLCSHYPRIISCFPQMKPETSRQSTVDSLQTEVDSPQEEALDVELTDEEKLILNLLKENLPVDLNELKRKTGLSNKKWDLVIKKLRNHNLVKVEKSEEGLLVSLL